MNEVDIKISGIEPPRWLEQCKSFVLKVLEKRHIMNWEVSILICNDRDIQELNSRYLEVDRPTDVLSFSQDSSELEGFLSNDNGNQKLAGDVIISLETLNRNAKQAGVPAEEELKRVLIHGLLHLEGIDHEETGSEMITIQERILKELNKERIF